MTRSPRIRQDCRQYPDGFNAALSALDYALGPSTEVVVSGDSSIAETQATFVGP